MKKFTQLIFFCLLLVTGVLLDIAPIHVPDGVDKVCHFIGFSLITVFAILTFVSFFGKKWINFFLMFLLVFGGVFAGLSEFLQFFTAARDCSVGDWITNLSGIAFVVLIMFFVNARNVKT